MRYQGEDAVVVEGEARWNFYRRWSVVGFLGAGTVTAKFNQLDDRKPVVYNQGIGVRYRIARLFGLDAGIDLAHSSDGWAVYIQIGSGWARSL
jgi:outer membrane translocation and assembly module TamA